MQPTHTPDCFLQAQEANDSARRRQNVLCEGLKHCLELSVSRELPPKHTLSYRRKALYQHETEN